MYVDFNNQYGQSGSEALVYLEVYLNVLRIHLCLLKT